MFLLQQLTDLSTWNYGALSLMLLCVKLQKIHFPANPSYSHLTDHSRESPSNCPTLLTLYFLSWKIAKVISYPHTRPRQSIWILRRSVCAAAPCLADWDAWASAQRGKASSHTDNPLRCRAPAAEIPDKCLRESAENNKNITIMNKDNGL